MCASGWDTHTHTILAGETFTVGLSLFMRFLDNKKIWNITRRQHFNSYLSSDFPESREPLVNGFHFGLTSYIILSWSSSALRFHYVESTCSNVTDRPSGNNTEREADGVMQRERERCWGRTERDRIQSRYSQKSGWSEWSGRDMTSSFRHKQQKMWKWSWEWLSREQSLYNHHNCCVHGRVSEEAQRTSRESEACIVPPQRESLVCLMTADTNKHHEEEEVCFKTNTHTMLSHTAPLIQILSY